MAWVQNIDGRDMTSARLLQSTKDTGEQLPRCSSQNAWNHQHTRASCHEAAASSMVAAETRDIRRLAPSQQQRQQHA
ncbi:hypothetical protein E2C01_005720 [Portunus trituberculatus]|uniref:Uncharacterized protein n=1 Tax=Portunus trituberculatus TaxID=210409 RepID=A0A5B7CTF5_PORTR|nr:hypothetical protein [Portunus trituberculatus]